MQYNSIMFQKKSPHKEGFFEINKELILKIASFLKFLEEPISFEESFEMYAVLEQYRTGLEKSNLDISFTASSILLSSQISS